MSNFLTRRNLILGAAGIAALGAAAGYRLMANGATYNSVVPGRPDPRRSQFNPQSTAEMVTEGMDLSRKTALITGCNSGLGLETMRVLALRGAHVIGAARTEKKAVEACESVDGQTTPLVIELTDLAGIVDAAEKVAATNAAIDMLILNAGVMMLPERRRANGVELHFAINHLGHFLLANRLMKQITASPAGRVVTVSSNAYRWASKAGIQFDNLDAERGYSPREAYGQSKLANGLFSRELARRLADTNATSNSLHPGVIPTNLWRHADRKRGDKSIPQGAATQTYLATSSDVDRVTGWYFEDCNPVVPDESMQDDKMAQRLWSVSEELVQEYLA